ncbi:MAG: SDR family NAD(P)-dependent oxidoreductase [Bacteroidota bacterium]
MLSKHRFLLTLKRKPAEVSSTTKIFQNKVAVITGAAIGIGFEIATQLVQAGANILLNDVDKDATEQAVAQIEKQGGKAIGFVGDAGNITAIEAMINKAVRTFGRLDFAIANAGITTFGPFLDYSEEQFQQLTQLNLQGTFFLAQQAAKQMIAQGEGGRILLMSSVTGHTYHPDLTAYGMSKAAIIFLAKTLGVELAKANITVNAISPGATLTERTTDSADGNYQAQWERTTPNGRCATTKDIAHTALFLLSDQAQHITSQTIIVDGGWTATSPPPK